MWPLYSTQFSIVPSDNRSEALVASEVFESILSWIGEFYKKKSIRFPDPQDVSELVWHADRPLQRRSIDIESGEFHRSLLWTHADTTGQPYYWTTRCDLAFAGGLLDFQLLLGCDSPNMKLNITVPSPSRPRIIPNLLENPHWICKSGGYVLTAQATVLTGPEIERFCDERLFSEGRRMPLVVCSPSDDRNNRYPVTPNLLAERLAGNAHVARLRDSFATRILDQYVGRPMAIGPFALRVFSTRLTSGETGDCHWLFRGEIIRESFQEPSKFANYLLAQVARVGVATLQESSAIVAFRNLQHAQRILRERQYEALRQHHEKEEVASLELLDSTGRENEELRAENSRQREELQQRDDRIRTLEQELRAAQANIINLSAELGRGVIQHAEKPVAQTQQKTVLDVVLDARTRHAHIEILESASESAAGVPEAFKSVDRAEAALEAIEAGAAACALKGRMPSGWKAFFGQYGFDYKKISETARVQFGNEYQFLYQGRRVFFEEHFTIGCKGANTCLSIHFNTRLARGKIVVAYVGRHLKNTQS